MTMLKRIQIIFFISKSPLSVFVFSAENINKDAGLKEQHLYDCYILSYSIPGKGQGLLNEGYSGRPRTPGLFRVQTGQSFHILFTKYMRAAQVYME